ncbi:hypothetical protein [Delftia phage PhiW-14]|uniref:Uncharacterized protein n=1 Tax=Delftia phage PhiW-14 TaxID=665032 RepID=C9DGG4_BPW14|nr:hypothetical protein DP-phiW-14_gp194 [Delftia phage PhiW-14]ACV50215.1 hypothetical protein [Delftia phage PhiW-14]
MNAQEMWDAIPTEKLREASRSLKRITQLMAQVRLYAKEPGVMKVDPLYRDVLTALHDEGLGTQDILFDVVLQLFDHNVWKQMAETGLLQGKGISDDPMPFRGEKVSSDCFYTVGNNDVDNKRDWYNAKWVAFPANGHETGKHTESFSYMIKNVAQWFWLRDLIDEQLYVHRMGAV